MDGKEISISFKFPLRSLSFLHTGTSPVIVFKFQVWNRFDAGFCCIIAGSLSNTDAIRHTCIKLKRCSVKALQELGKDLQDSQQEPKSRMLPYTGSKMTKAHRKALLTILFQVNSEVSTFFRHFSSSLWRTLAAFSSTSITCLAVTRRKIQSGSGSPSPSIWLTSTGWHRSTAKHKTQHRSVHAAGLQFLSIPTILGIMIQLQR